MQYKWVVLSNTTLAVLMATIDINIVIIALPTIQRQLPHTTVFDVLWVLIGYNLIISTVLVNFGRLADMYGRVKLYNLGFVGFTVGSALCSLSQNGTELIAFRMVQGVGSAFLIANSTAIITDAFPPNERGKALGINRVSQVVGATMGLVVGGALTQVAGWQSIFWVNVPIGVFASIWSHYKLRELGIIERGQKLDLGGNVTFVLSLTSLLLGVTLYSFALVDLLETALFIAAGFVLMAVFIVIERRTENPMLDLSLFRLRVFTGGTLATFLNSLARGCVLLVMTSYLQGPTMNLDPLTAGIFILPNSASLAFWGPISGWLSDRGGARFYASLGLVVTFAGFLLLSQIGPTSSFYSILLPMLLVGSGEGIFNSPNRASVMNAVPAQRRGVGSAFNIIMLNLGNTFSRAFAFLVMGLLVPSGYLLNLFAGSADLTGGPIFVADFIGSLHLLFYMCAAFVALSIIPSIMREPIHREADDGKAAESHGNLT